MAPVTTDAKPKTADGGKAVADPLSAEELRKMDAYFRALNYLTVGQIYLLDNPVMKEPLKREHIKPRLLGHWGTSPGLNMLCVHLNRVIKRDDLNMIYINIVNLMKLQSPSEHPHGLPDGEFDALFTKDKPIIFAFHGYPWLIHRLTYRRTNHKNLHVHGYKEEGTTTTPFDMVVLNAMDRFHLVEAVIDQLPQMGARAAYIYQAVEEKLIEHKHYIRQHGDDMPEIAGWRWSSRDGATAARSARRTSTEGDNV